MVEGVGTILFHMAVSRPAASGALHEVRLESAPPPVQLSRFVQDNEQNESATERASL